MRRLAFLLLFVTLVAPLVGSAAPNPITVGFAPQGSKVIQVVGGTRDAEWVDAQKIKFLGAARWRYFTLTGSGPEVLASDRTEDGTGSAIVTVKETVKQDALAVSGLFVTQPRKGRVVKPDPTLQVMVLNLLRGRGVKADKARIVQCVQVDLLGDGDPELLFVARSRDNVSMLGPARTDRDYVVAGMAWVEPRGPRRASILHVEPIHFEGQKPKDEVGQDYTWVGVADVEGKGRMVAALRSTYYEGGGMELLAFDGKRVKTLVAEGWGL